MHKTDIDMLFMSPRDSIRSIGWIKRKFFILKKKTPMRRRNPPLLLLFAFSRSFWILIHKHTTKQPDSHWWLDVVLECIKINWAVWVHFLWKRHYKFNWKSKWNEIIFLKASSTQWHCSVSVSCVRGDACSFTRCMTHLKNSHFEVIVWEEENARSGKIEEKSTDENRNPLAHS